MKNRSMSLAVTIVLGIALQGVAAEQVKPVQMGRGLMTFDTVPGWGLSAEGKSVLGPTHGGVVIDKAGNIYTSARIGVIVFSPDGKVIRRFLGNKYSNIHDLEIRDEAEGEFIYAARNSNAEGIKFNVRDGKIVLRDGAFPRFSAKCAVTLSGEHARVRVANEDGARVQKQQPRSDARVFLVRLVFVITLEIFVSVRTRSLSF